MSLTLETLLHDLAEPLSLKLVGGAVGLHRAVETPDLNRPGLALAGFLDYFPPERIQVIGKTEIALLKTFDPGTRKDRIETLCRLKPIAFVLSHGQAPPSDLLESAAACGVPVFATPVPTMKFMSELLLHLEERLAPAETVHGCLVDVFGVGVLLVGESGIGKSECALALLDKGHRLCADDVVEIRRTPEKTLVGAGTRSLKYHMEIRGLGIVDVQQLFGSRAVRERKLVELAIQLVPWESGRSYDRTGLEELIYPVLDVPLPLHVLPVKMGRNIAVLVEVAAMNYRLKQMGVNPAERLEAHILKDLQTRKGPGRATHASSRPIRAARGAAASRRRRHEER